MTETTRKLTLAEAALNSKPEERQFATKVDQTANYTIYIVNMAQRRLDSIKNQIELLLKSSFMDANRLKLVDKETDAPLRLLHLDFIEPHVLLLNWINAKIAMMTDVSIDSVCPFFAFYFQVAKKLWWRSTGR